MVLVRRRNAKTNRHQTKPPQGSRFAGVFVTRAPKCKGEDASSLRCHAFGRFHILVDLVEVQVLVDGCAVFVHDAHGFVVFGHRGELAHLRGDGSQLSRRQEHVGVLAQTVGEVTGRSRHHSGALTHLRLVAHAQGAARHFSACTGGTECSIVAFFDQLALVHLGGRCHP